MKNKIFFCASIIEEDYSWELTDKFSCLYSSASWLEWICDHHPALSDRIAFLQNRKAKVIRENKIYYFTFNNEKDYLEYCLKFGGIFKEEAG